MFVLLANHESLSFLQAWASSIICNKDGGQSWVFDEQPENSISEYEARQWLWDLFHDRGSVGDVLLNSV